MVVQLLWISIFVIKGLSVEGRTWNGSWDSAELVSQLMSCSWWQAQRLQEVRCSWVGVLGLAEFETSCLSWRLIGWLRLRKWSLEIRSCRCWLELCCRRSLKILSWLLSALPTELAEWLLLLRLSSLVLLARSSKFICGIVWKSICLLALKLILIRLQTWSKILLLRLKALRLLPKGSCLSWIVLRIRRKTFKLTLSLLLWETILLQVLTKLELARLRCLLCILLLIVLVINPELYRLQCELASSRSWALVVERRPLLKSCSISWCSLLLIRIQAKV